MQAINSLLQPSTQPFTYDMCPLAGFKPALNPESLPGEGGRALIAIFRSQKPHTRHSLQCTDHGASPPTWFSFRHQYSAPTHDLQIFSGRTSLVPRPGLGAYLRTLVSCDSPEPWQTAGCGADCRQLSPRFWDDRVRGGCIVCLWGAAPSRYVRSRFWELTSTTSVML